MDQTQNFQDGKVRQKLIWPKPFSFPGSNWTEMNCERLFLYRGTTTRRFVGHTKDVLSVAFSSDNRQIVSGSRDKTIKLWNTLGVCKYTVQVSGKSLPLPQDFPVFFPLVLYVVRPCVSLFWYRLGQWGQQAEMEIHIPLSFCYTSSNRRNCSHVCSQREVEVEPLSVQCSTGPAVH